MTRPQLRLVDVFLNLRASAIGYGWTAEPSRMCIGIGATVSWPDEAAHNADENQEAASCHEPMPKLECLQQLNQSAHFFAFSPIWTSRRMASGRLILLPCFSTQSSIAAN